MLNFPEYVPINEPPVFYLTRAYRTKQIEWMALRGVKESANKNSVAYKAFHAVISALEEANYPCEEIPVNRNYTLCCIDCGMNIEPVTNEIEAYIKAIKNIKLVKM